MGGFVIVMRSPDDANPYWVKRHAIEGRDTWHAESISDQAPSSAAIYTNKARADLDAEWLRNEAPKSHIEVKRLAD